MRTRLCAAVAVATAALTLGVGVSEAAAEGAPARVSQAVPAKKKPKRPKATTTTRAAKSAALPGDACKLLTQDEVTSLVPTATQGTPVKTTSANGPNNEVMCRWDAPDTVQDILVSVTSLPSSIPSAQLKAGLAAEARDSGKTVSGLGDYAIVTSTIPPDAEAKVLVGHLLLDVEYSSSDPLGSTRQDDVVSAARLAFGRL